VPREIEAWWTAGRNGERRRGARGFEAEARQHEMQQPEEGQAQG